MKKLTFALLSLLHFASAEVHSENLKLWYNKPANAWIEALPIGNGNLGAMVFGGVKDAEYQLNEDTLYLGEPHNYAREGASKYLKTVRELVFDGKQKEAHDFAQKNFMSDPITQTNYQPLGGLKLNFPGHDKFDSYKRSLDLSEGVVTTSYKVGDVTYTRKAIASYPDQLIAIHISADQGQKVSFSAALNTPHKDNKVEVAGDVMCLTGELPKEQKHKWFKNKVRKFKTPLKFESRLNIKIDGGSLKEQDGKLHVVNADSATIILSADTSHVSFKDISGDPKAKCHEVILAAKDKQWTELLNAHQEDYKELFGRVSIDLGSSGKENLTTEQRLRDATKKDNDPGLAALIYQYGRYLLISSSRAGTQPATLQGIWNKETNPPWGSRYTVNINTEMNYWPAEMTNLSECHAPLFEALDEIAQSGATTAKEYYGARGWTLHHNFDLWRASAPINKSNHGIWPTGGAWLCQHLWWHYEYGEDTEFLKKAYPLMRGAALFFVDHLIEDPRNDKGWLISTPSNSPENGGLVAGPTMDHQIIRNLFNNVIKASEILSIDPDFRAKLAGMVPKIAPNQIGKHGQLQEWLEDVDNPKNQHRHVSHLWGLHPGDEINWQDTPEFFKAAKQSLNFRGDSATGWSMGWKMNFWARFLDGQRAKKIYDNFTTYTRSHNFSSDGAGLYPNLFCAHPPFQIDGNFGTTAGITEMVMQCHVKAEDGSRLIHLLPALPKAWHTGHLTGIRARGDVLVDVYWQGNKVTKFTLTSPKKDQTRTIKVGDKLHTVKLTKGVAVTTEVN